MLRLGLAAIALIGFTLTPLAVQAQTVEDEVIARGQIQGGDPAMSAFLNGDYVTAEIEFKKNFKDLIRIENLNQRGFEQAQNNQTSALLREGPVQVGPRGGNAAAPRNDQYFDVRGLQQSAKGDETTLVSGDDKGYQLYMTALSQLQLKKYDEAKTNFKRAVRFNSALHDAHFRAGLLELREGNRNAAETHMLGLRKAWKRCKKTCEQHPYIESNLRDLGVALARGS